MAEDTFSAHRNVETMRLDAGRAAVIVVDMVNDFCKPGGAMVLRATNVWFGHSFRSSSSARQRCSCHLGARRASAKHAAGS